MIFKFLNKSEKLELCGIEPVLCAVKEKAPPWFNGADNYPPRFYSVSQKHISKTQTYLWIIDNYLLLNRKHIFSRSFFYLLNWILNFPAPFKTQLRLKLTSLVLLRKQFANKTKNKICNSQESNWINFCLKVILNASPQEKKCDERDHETANLCWNL